MAQKVPFSHLQKKRRRFVSIFRKKTCAKTGSGQNARKHYPKLCFRVRTEAVCTRLRHRGIGRAMKVRIVPRVRHVIIAADAARVKYLPACT
jgi:hypothetical protein